MKNIYTVNKVINLSEEFDKLDLETKRKFIQDEFDKLSLDSQRVVLNNMFEKLPSKFIASILKDEYENLNRSDMMDVYEHINGIKL